MEIMPAASKTYIKGLRNCRMKTMIRGVFFLPISSFAPYWAKRSFASFSVRPEIREQVFDNATSGVRLCHAVLEFSIGITLYPNYLLASTPVDS